MRGVSGVALAMPLVGFGQQPGWVQDVPWIQTASVDVHSWIAEAGRLNHGWGLSGACQWLHERTNEARLRFEVFKPDGTMELELEASAGGEWRGDHWLVRWHVEWGNRSDVHPLWIKCRREWPEGVAVEAHWRTAQTSGPDVRASQRLEFRGHWCLNLSSFR